MSDKAGVYRMLLESLFLLTLSFQNGTCAAALEAAPQYACAQGRTGIALATTQEGADLLLARAEAAEPRFRQHFGQDPAPYLVLYFEEDPPRDALYEAGFETMLPWPSPVRLGELMTAALRQNALARVEGGGPLSEDAEATLRLQTAAMLALLDEKQGGVVSHELGHIWYTAAFWRDRSAGDGYATPAPDWLDEAAAVLTEGDELGANRRQLFAEGWAALTPENLSAHAAIGDLTHFLQRPHPQQTRETPANDSTAAGPARVTVRSGPNDREAYYNQVRVFADYLIVRTGDEAIFFDVSRALADGMDFEGWLASQTRYPSLPRTVPELQADWASWIDGGGVRPRT